ncbi:hypothetical protein [Geomicrobium sp. JCM 19039]|uniref:hypothetical protein n=1 Tax=Geomicrobium sp. JCM 19039 TaxID=1460636 RepID=UPI0005AA4374|nr:hypothetical protein [Geomicrobium sp. JCM 19039]
MIKTLQGSALEFLLSVLSVFLAALVAYLTTKIKRYLYLAADRAKLGIIGAITIGAVERIEEQFFCKSRALHLKRQHNLH